MILKTWEDALMQILVAFGKRLISYSLAAIAGAIVWLIACKLFSELEAWDNPAYFSIFVPTLAIFIGLLAFTLGGNKWGLAFIGGAGQFAVMLFNQGFGNLWPLGIIAMAVISLPSVVGGHLGHVIRRKISSKDQDTKESA
jgi:hypothetical protein